MQPTNKSLYEKIVQNVKSKVTRWPSAYASGLVVKEYKEAMKKLGKKPYVTDNKDSTLNRWFKEKWIDIATNKPCGKAKTKDYYPTCRPSVRVNKKTPVTINEMTRKQKETMIKEKQKTKQHKINFYIYKT